jgi:predicted  nucleic acid-binding Zn-ribbon protein
VTLKADLIAKREELQAKRSGLAALFEQANTTTDETKRHELLGSIKSANLELSALVDAIDPLQDAVMAEDANQQALKSMRQPVGRQVDPESEHVDRDVEGETRSSPPASSPSAS